VDSKLTKEAPRLSVWQSVRKYWLNLLAVALTPVAMLLMSKAGLYGNFAPLAFVALILFGVGTPYYFGKAPYGYVIVAALVYFFLGGLAMIVVATAMGN
jgi:hypothetical protein